MSSINTVEAKRVSIGIASTPHDDASLVHQFGPVGFAVLGVVTWIGGGIYAMIGEQAVVSVITACSGILLAWIGRSLKIELARIAKDRYTDTRIHKLEREKAIMAERLKSAGVHADDIAEESDQRKAPVKRKNAADDTTTQP